MKKFMIIVFLLLCGVGFGANKFVTPTGAGAKTGADWANAFDTVIAGYNAVASGDIVFIAEGAYTESVTLQTVNKSVIFEGVKDGDETTPADRTLLTWGSEDSGTMFEISTFGATTDALITLKNMTITGGASTDTVILRVRGTQADIPDLTLDNCIVSQGVGTAIPISLSTTLPTASCILIITDSALSTVASIDVITSVGANQVTITGSNISSVDGRCLWMTDTTDRVLDFQYYLQNNEFTVTGTGQITFDQFISTAEAGGTFRFLDNTCAVLNSGVQMSGFATLADVSRNTFVSSNVSGGGVKIVSLGRDDVVSVDILQTIVQDNVITYTGTDEAHAFLIGFGCNEAIVTHNKVYGVGGVSGFGIVAKTQNSKIEYNLLRCSRPLLIRDGTNNYVYGNTFISLFGAAVGWDKVVGVDPKRNVLLNNIIDGRLGSYAVLNNGEIEGIRLDYNDYLGGDTGFANNGGAIADFDAWKTWTQSGFFAENDSSSLGDIDPQYDVDYKPTNPLVTKGGKPDANGSDTSMGAIGAITGGKTSIYGNTQKSIYGTN